jgi:hypothetical protein
MRTKTGKTTFKISAKPPPRWCEQSHRPTEERPMPTFDGGHYFLTALVPIRTDIVDDGLASTSPVHALRKRLDMLPTAAETPACRGGQSPLARNKRNHFARFVIIDDVAYNGRNQRNTLVSALCGDNLVAAQPQDHLSCPFLLFSADFDAASGADAERNSYIAELWQTMGDELHHIFGFCQGFEGTVTDAASFAKYIADCQLETTMSFNDYYVDPLNLPIWPKKAFGLAAAASFLVLVLGLITTLLLFGSELLMPPWVSALRYATVLTIFATGVLAIVIAAAYATLMTAGSKPFPTAPDSNLPTVLKALHLQRAFTRFAIDSQMQASATDAVSAQKLYDDFAAFVADNRPADLGAPTQAPGVIGI